MKNTFTATLFAVFLTAPLLASANVEIIEGEYLNVDNGSELTVLNIDPLANAKPSDLNEWGSNWGSKVPFKGNVPHDVAAYGTDVSSYFPKF